MSWNNRTENELWPPSLFIRPFSPNVCNTIAVEDNAKTQPMAKPICHAIPKAIAMPMTANAVIKTCIPPSPKRRARMPHSILGSNSRPTKNSIITTPNSAKCWMAITSTPRPAKTGEITTPAIKYPRTDPSPNRDAKGTAITPAIKKTVANTKKSVISASDHLLD